MIPASEFTVHLERSIGMNTDEAGTDLRGPEEHEQIPMDRMRSRCHMTLNV